MGLPEYITHYFEADRGPFRNICDLSEEDARKLVSEEENATTAFNRFAMGPDFLAWRREADDLLIRAYSEKFGCVPEGRPYFAVLGSFDKTLTMFREGRKIEMEVSGFSEKELTFMYPDHAHLVTVYGADAPALFYQPPTDWSRESFWGRLFTLAELREEYSRLGIDRMIRAHEERDGWAGCYVEAQLWRRGLRGEG
ncbi:hypothetical protein [Luteolibacter soli]|uniref:Uncharacterized protein n=1 Tax=Luteolibacter soli TaxID=3135280 RepID=A0ABU9AUH4_9BACT